MCEPRYDAQPQRSQCGRAQQKGPCRSHIQSRQEPKWMGSPPPACRKGPREPTYGAQPQRTQCARAQQQGPCRSKIQQHKEPQCKAPPPPVEYEEFDIDKQLPPICRAKCPSEHVPAACKFINEFRKESHSKKKHQPPPTPQYDDVQAVSPHDTMADLNITTSTLLEFSENEGSQC